MVLNPSTASSSSAQSLHLEYPFVDMCPIVASSAIGWELFLLLREFPTRTFYCIMLKATPYPGSDGRWEFSFRGRAREAERALQDACPARFGTLRP